MSPDDVGKKRIIAHSHFLALFLDKVRLRQEMSFIVLILLKIPLSMKSNAIYSIFLTPVSSLCWVLQCKYQRDVSNVIFLLSIIINFMKQLSNYLDPGYTYALPKKKNLHCSYFSD